MCFFHNKKKKLYESTLTVAVAVEDKFPVSLCGPRNPQETSECCAPEGKAGKLTP